MAPADVAKRALAGAERPRGAFGRARLRTIASLVEVLFSTVDDRGLVAARPELVSRVTKEFDRMIGAGSGDLRRGYRLFAWLIEWLPLAIIGAPARASDLPLARRLAYLERLERARFALLATMLQAFKLPLTMLAFEVGPELDATGFDRRDLATPRANAEQRAPSDAATVRANAEERAPESAPARSGPEAEPPHREGLSREVEEVRER